MDTLAPEYETVCDQTPTHASRPARVQAAADAVADAWQAHSRTIDMIFEDNDYAPDELTAMILAAANSAIAAEREYKQAYDEWQAELSETNQESEQENTDEIPLPELQ